MGSDGKARVAATIVCSLALSGWALPGEAAEEPPIRPNFVFVLTDDQRWDTIGRCAGGLDGSDLADAAVSCMPFLAGDLGSEGTSFLRAYATTALCCPSRASILTGQYSRHTGVVHNQLGFDAFDDVSTLATWLDEAGYRTGLFGKYLNWYGESGTPPRYIPPGWDSWHAFYPDRRLGYTRYPLLERDPGEEPVETNYDSAASTTGAACAEGNYYSTDLLCHRTMEFLRADLEAPFFAYLSVFSPHTSPLPPGRWTGFYAGLPLPLYPNVNQVPSPNPPSWLAPDPRPQNTINAWRAEWRRQLDTNRAVDDGIHALYEELRADGRLDRTVFVFMSDNGIGRGEHRWNGKACAYEECSRIPLVIRCPPAVCPDAAPGTIDAEHLALNIDIAPTIAELAGVTPPPSADGESLVPLLDGGEPSWRTSFILEDTVPWDLQGVLADLEDGHTYKYIEGSGGAELELYDLTEDPWELANLADDGLHGTVQARLAERLRQAHTAPVVTLDGPHPGPDPASAELAWASDEPVTAGCTLDDGPAEPCGSGTGGSVLYQGLSDGTHRFVLRAADPDNNAVTLERVFTVDSQPPVPPTLTEVPPDPSLPTATFGFAHEKPGMSFRCSLDAAPATACTSPLTYQGLADGAHTFEVVAVDFTGRFSDPAWYAWTVEGDTTPPKLTMNTPSFDMLRTSEIVAASWSGSDNDGLDRFDVFEREGVTGTQALVQSSLGTTFRRTGELGATYCYQVWAFDHSGNSAPGGERCTAVPHDDRSTAIALAGEVSQPSSAGAFQGTLTSLDGDGARADLAFTGRRVGILAQRGPAAGRAEVWVDGALVATVDLYAASVGNKAWVLTRTLPYGAHTVSVRWTGTRNASSSGTAIPLDAIAFIG